MTGTGIFTLGLWFLAALLGWAVDDVLSHRTAAVQWYGYCLALVVAALISQVAEWVHLQVMKDQNVLLASLFAIAFSIPEYLVSVPMQRLGFRLTRSLYAISLVWNAAQLLLGYVVMYTESRQAPDWRAFLGLFLALLSVAVQAL